MKKDLKDLIEAKRQIDSILHKLRETLKTLHAKEQKDRYKSQITLAERRIQALEIAVQLLEDEILKQHDCWTIKHSKNLLWYYSVRHNGNATYGYLDNILSRYQLLSYRFVLLPFVRRCWYLG